MRLFIATDIPSEVLDSISELRRELDPEGERARWVGPESIHLTLKFLGQVAPEQTEVIDQSLRAVRAAAFKVSISGVGFFPNDRSPRVFWVGVSSEGLTGLAQEVEQQMVGLGYPAESRPFSPHLTLARCSKKGRIHSSLVGAAAEYAEQKWGMFTTDRFFLYESHLERSGAVYEKLKEYPLRTPRNP